MKNNKVLCLIVFFISLFSFNFEVNAAQELTCLYAPESKVLLVQHSTGDIEVFLNDDKDATIESSGWISSDKYRFAFEMDDGLTSCPYHASTYYKIFGGIKEIVFYDDSEFIAYPSLELDLSEVKSPSSEATNPDSDIVVDSVGGVCSVDSWVKELDNSKYTGACLYMKPITDSELCHLVQINFGKDYILTTEYDSKKGVSNSGLSSFHDEKKYLFGEFKVNFTLDDFLENNGECSEMIRVDRDALTCELGMECSFYPYINTNVYLKGKKGDVYYLVNSKGTNPLTGESLKTFDEIVYNDINLLDCDQLFDENAEELKKLVKTIYTIIRFLIPIVIIALSSVDFAKSIFSGNEDDMKKTTKRFINRLIVAVCIFLAPILLKFVLNIAYEIWGILSPDFCGVL